MPPLLLVVILLGVATVLVLMISVNKYMLLLRELSLNIMIIYLIFKVSKIKIKTFNKMKEIFLAFYIQNKSENICNKTWLNNEIMQDKLYHFQTS